MKQKKKKDRIPKVTTYRWEDIFFVKKKIKFSFATQSSVHAFLLHPFLWKPNYQTQLPTILRFVANPGKFENAASSSSLATHFQESDFAR